MTIVFDTHYWQPGKVTYSMPASPWPAQFWPASGKKTPVANAPTPPSPSILYIGGEYVLGTYVELSESDSFYIEMERGIENSLASDHAAGTNVYDVIYKSLPLYNLPPASYNMDFAPAFVEPWPYVSYIDSQTFLQEFKNLLQKPLPVTALSCAGCTMTNIDITFTWTFQSRNNPAVIPEDPLKYYPQDASFPFHDQYTGYLLNFYSYPRSGLTPTVYLSTTLGVQPVNASYISTYSSRTAAGLTSSFELDVCVKGVYGYNSITTIQVINEGLF